MSITTDRIARPGVSQVQSGRLAVPEGTASYEGMQLLAHWLSRGARPFDHGGEAACHDKHPDFLTLEAEVEDILATGGRAAERARRIEFVERAAARLCGPCPFRVECQRWAEADPFYEGIAAGKVVVADWRANREELLTYAREENHDQPRWSEHESIIDRRGRPVPRCSHHGELMRWNADVRVADGGYWRCTVPREEVRP